MGSLLMLSTEVIDQATVAASRGAGAANLLTSDPKEVWADAAAGSAATIDIDLGAVRAIDTVALAAVYGAAAGASWTITGGVAAHDELTVKAAGALRAIDAAGAFPAVSHALWTGAAANLRYLRISLTQPGGNPALKVGRLIAGRAFRPTWNKEWGAGRGVVDTGTATRLPSGGLAMVEGARFGTYAWTLGDLTDAEVEELYALQLAVGETGPLLVVEDPDATAGQRNRIHYGRLAGLRRFDRRSANRTRWEFTVEDWI